MIAGGSVVEDLKVLVELREVDARIHEVETEKAKKPRVLSLAAEPMREAKAAMDEAQTAFDTASREKRTLDTELTTENEHLRKMKLRSTEIKTNKEYFAHLKEMEECQKKISKMEETVLELMEKLDTAEKDLAEKKKAFEDESAKFEQARAGIEEQFSVHGPALTEYTAKRAELLPRISRETAVQYEAILRRYPDSPVVEAINGACSGCRMTLPPQVYNNVRKGEALVVCIQCHRILFYAEPLKEAQ